MGVWSAHLQDVPKTGKQFNPHKALGGVGRVRREGQGAMWCMVGEKDHDTNEYGLGI